MVFWETCELILICILTPTKKVSQSYNKTYNKKSDEGHLTGQHGSRLCDMQINYDHELVSNAHLRLPTVPHSLTRSACRGLYDITVNRFVIIFKLLRKCSYSLLMNFVCFLT